MSRSRCLCRRIIESRGPPHYFNQVVSSSSLSFIDQLFPRPSHPPSQPLPSLPLETLPLCLSCKQFLRRWSPLSNDLAVLCLGSFPFLYCCQLSRQDCRLQPTDLVLDVERCADVTMIAMLLSSGNLHHELRLISFLCQSQPSSYFDVRNLAEVWQRKNKSLDTLQRIQSPFSITPCGLDVAELDALELWALLG
jgi:hypothetical protein